MEKNIRKAVRTFLIEDKKVLAIKYNKEKMINIKIVCDEKHQIKSIEL